VIFPGAIVVLSHIDENPAENRGRPTRSPVFKRLL
jgi:hypothetical protein